MTAAPAHPPDDDLQLLDRSAKACGELKRQVARAVVGQEGVVDGLLVTLLARGHALLVGVPGLAKTLLVSSMAQALGLSFGRIQFTPDLLPADITGTDVLNEIERGGVVRRELSFMQGPIFHNLVLADEINRTPPKTQAALLQAMQERRVTVGGVTHALPDPFEVFATQNPIEQEGTYPLLEAQLDRFLLEVHIDYPSEAEEQDIARRTTSGENIEIEPVVSLEELKEIGELVPRVPITDEAVELAAKARAVLRGEAAADIEDIQAMILSGLRHRIVLSYRAEADGVRDSDVLAAVRKRLGV